MTSKPTLPPQIANSQAPPAGRRPASPSYSRIQTAAAVVGALLCGVVALASLRYLMQLGPVPPNIAQNTYRTPWLVIHVAGAALALLVSPIQFVRRVRQAAPRVHRWLGRLYVVGCTVGGVSGIVLALGSSTGPISTVGFGILAVAWLITTTLAWTRAVQRRFTEHRAWMIRSFALTFAAVTLRLYLPVAVGLQIPFEPAYQAISFLCWIPNLALAEIYLRRGLVGGTAA